MTTRLMGGFAAGVLMVFVGAAPAEAGAGHAAAASGEAASVARVAHQGHARDFDWHRQKTRPVRAGMTDSGRRQTVRIAGRGSWICSPAGAGSGSSCRAR